MRRWWPLLPLAVAVSLTLWVTNTVSGERFAERDWFGEFIFGLWVAGGVPVLVRLIRIARPRALASETTPSEEGGSGGPKSSTETPQRILARVVLSVMVLAMAFGLAASIIIDPECFECVEPRRVIGSIVAFIAVSALGLWATWRGTS